MLFGVLSTECPDLLQPKYSAEQVAIKLCEEFQKHEENKGSLSSSDNILDEALLKVIEKERFDLIEEEKEEGNTKKAAPHT